MNSTEAVLHYGITAADPPSSMTVRDMFFAAALHECGARLITRLMRTYEAAWDAEQEENDEPKELECVSWTEAEKLYIEAYEKASGMNAEGAAFLDDMILHTEVSVPKKLIVDLGHLLGFKDRSESRRMFEWMQKLGEAQTEVKP